MIAGCGRPSSVSRSAAPVLASGTAIRLAVAPRGLAEAARQDLQAEADAERGVGTVEIRRRSRIDARLGNLPSSLALIAPPRITAAS
jgi:hypothetical protein